MAAAVTRQVRRGSSSYLPAGDDVRALIQRDGPDALDQRIVDAERVALLVLAMPVQRHAGRCPAMAE